LVKATLFSFAKKKKVLQPKKENGLKMKMMNQLFSAWR